MPRWQEMTQAERDELVQTMMAEGKSIRQISEALGVGGTTVARGRMSDEERRERADRENRARRIARKAARDGRPNLKALKLTLGENPAVRAEAERLAARIPADTRSLTGRLMGDPLPTRSALDKERQGRSA